MLLSLKIIRRPSCCSFALLLEWVFPKVRRKRARSALRRVCRCVPRLFKPILPISIGNVQLWFTSWQFCPLDGVLIIAPKRRILHRKKIMKKFVKLYLHSSYTIQNSFHLDEIFHKKNHEKVLVKVCLRSSYTLQNSFHFDEILHRKYKIPFDAI